MSSTRSDSDLHAPRRLGAVPSSADRNALDFYDHDGDGTDDDRSDNDHLSIDACRAKSSPPDLGTFALSSSLAANKLGSSKSVGTLSEPPQHPQDDASLTKKFEDLKRLMNSKKKLPATTPSSQSQAKANHEEQPSRTKSTSKNRDNSTSSTAKSAGDKAAASTAKAAKSGATSDTKRGDAESRRHAPTSAPVVVKTPPIKSKKDMAIRNGISLSDLKEEHRAALEMLKELGGPMDTDYDRDSVVEERVATRTKVVRSSRSTKPKDDTDKSTAAGHSCSQKSSSAVLAGKVAHHNSSSVVSRELPEQESPQSSSPVGCSGGSLVAKLRASIPSGRVRTPELVAADREGVRSDASPRELPECYEPASVRDAAPLNPVAVTSATSAFALIRQERSLEDVEEVDEENDREDISETQQVASEDNLWKQYDDDENGAEDDEEEDEEEEEDERFESETSGGSAPATARSVDLYGDEGFESEW